jgi:hypothetical protein
MKGMWSFLAQRQSDGTATSGSRCGNGGKTTKPQQYSADRGLVAVAMHVLLGVLRCVLVLKVIKEVVVALLADTRAANPNLETVA